MVTFAAKPLLAPNGVPEALLMTHGAINFVLPLDPTTAGILAVWLEHLSEGP